MHVVQYLMHHSTVMFDGTCVMLNKYIQCAVFIQFTMNLLWINYITLYNQLYIVLFWWVNWFEWCFKMMHVLHDWSTKK